jgi:DNA-binding NtrC family response regulator
VRWFVAKKLDEEGQREMWTERIVGYIAEKLPGHAWTRNLRELKHLTERYLLTSGKMPKPPVVTSPAEPAGEAAPGARRAPESVCAPSSGLLGPMAKRGHVSARKLTEAYVTEVFITTGQNLAETARKTGMHRRTVRGLIDRARLARRLARRR